MPGFLVYRGLCLMSFFTSLIGDNKSRIVNDRVSHDSMIHSDQAKDNLSPDILQESVVPPVFGESENNNAQFNLGSNENEHSHSRMPIRVENKSEKKASSLNYSITEDSIADDEQKNYDEIIPEPMISASDLSIEKHQNSGRFEDTNNTTEAKNSLVFSTINNVVCEAEPKFVKPQNDNTDEKLSIQTNESLKSQPDSFIAEKVDMVNEQAELKSTALKNKLFVEPSVELLKNSPENNHKAHSEMLENNKLFPAHVKNKAEKVSLQDKNQLNVPVKEDLLGSDWLSDDTAKTSRLKTADLKKSFVQAQSDNETAVKTLNPLSHSEKKSKPEPEKDIPDNKTTSVVKKTDKKFINEPIKTQNIIKPDRENSGPSQTNELNHTSQNHSIQSQSSQRKQSPKNVIASPPRVTIGKLDIVVMSKQVEKTNKRNSTRHNDNVSQLLYLRGI